MCDGVVFTNKRIIAVNVQGITNRSKAPKELGANNASQFTENPVGAKLNWPNNSGHLLRAI